MGRKWPVGMDFAGQSFSTSHLAWFAHYRSLSSSREIFQTVHRTHNQSQLSYLLTSARSIGSPPVAHSRFFIHAVSLCIPLFISHSPHVFQPCREKAWKTEMKQHLSEPFSTSSVHSESVSNENRILSDIHHSRSPDQTLANVSGQIRHHCKPNNLAFL